MVYSRHNAKQNLLSALKYKDKEGVKDIIASYIAKNVTLNRDKVVAALNDAGIKASPTESTPSLIDKVVKNLANKGLVNGIKVIADTEMNFAGPEKEELKKFPEVGEKDLEDIKKRANEMTGNGGGSITTRKFIFWTAVTIFGLYLISNIKSSAPKMEEGGGMPSADPAMPPAPATPPAPAPIPAAAAAPAPAAAVATGAVN